MSDGSRVVAIAAVTRVSRAQRSHLGQALERAVATPAGARAQVSVIDEDGAAVTVARLSAVRAHSGPQADGELRERVRQELVTLVGPRTPVDIIIISGDLASSPPALVVTDVDSTLIVQEVIEELADRAGTREHVAAVTARAMNGELDFAQSLDERVATLKGIPESVFEQVLAQITPTLGAQSLIDAVHGAGGAFGVVSGGFEEVVAPLAKSMGIDYWQANSLEISGGFLTGRVRGPVVTAAVKAERLAQWAGEVGADVSEAVAVGDGANDVPMMTAAGLGVAFCAKDSVRAAIPNTLSISRLDPLIAVLGL